MHPFISRVTIETSPAEKEDRNRCNEIVEGRIMGALSSVTVLGRCLWHELSALRDELSAGCR